MIYIAVDTCVWLELLKTDFVQESMFDELLYYIESKSICCITTENLIREWHRNKEQKKKTVYAAFKERESLIGNLMSAQHNLREMYDADNVNTAIEKRILRLDHMFSNFAKVAKETDDIYLEAAKRNLDCIAPNHGQDSFRDTINILTLKEYVRENNIESCIFTTINHKDYSVNQSKKFDLHTQLLRDFEKWKLEYVFFDNDANNFSGRLFGGILRPKLPSFVEHLQKQKEDDERKKLSQRKVEQVHTVHVTDDEFIDNIANIDRIVESGKQTSADKFLLDYLFKKYPNYEKYFFKKLVENGLV